MKVHKALRSDSTFGLSSFKNVSKNKTADKQYDSAYSKKNSEVAGSSKQNTSAIFIIPGIIKHGVLFVFALSIYVVYNLDFRYSDTYNQFQNKKFHVS
jgi:hypothetical protein